MLAELFTSNVKLLFIMTYALREWCEYIMANDLLFYTITSSVIFLAFFDIKPVGVHNMAYHIL